MIVSFHLQRFYIWILIFHHQPIRPPSHQQRGRDPPVMTGADSRFYCDATTATAAITGNKIGIWAQLSLFWWFAKQRIPLLVCGVSSLLRGLHGAGAAQTRANTPGKAAGGQQLTVSLKQHSHSTKYEKLATNGGAIGTPAWALWGDWARPQEQWIRCQTGRPGAKTCLIFTQQ